MLFIFLLVITGTTGETKKKCSETIRLSTGERKEIVTNNYWNGSAAETDPPGTGCLWEVNAPADHRVIFICPITKQEKCTAVYKIFRFFDPQFFCNNNRFYVYSTDNALLISYNVNASVTENTRPIKCYVTTDDPGRLCYSCGRRNRVRSEARLLEGINTGVNEFPMMAALRRLNRIEFFCGATIISENYALTAASCVKKKKPNEIALVVGEHDRSKDDETEVTAVISIDRIVVHPDFRRTGETGFATHDIALVHVSTQIHFSRKVGPACLPFNYEHYGPVAVDFLGWGKSGQNTLSSRVLQKLSGNAYNANYTDTCKATLKDLPVERSHMCVQLIPYDGTCRGDSGGPVIQENPDTLQMFLMGIISTTHCFRSLKPAVSTRVSYYLDWIEKHTVEDRLCKKWSKVLTWSDPYITARKPNITWNWIW